MKIDFSKMTKEELKAYLLEHRDNQNAFYAYMDRLKSSPTIASHSPSDQESLQDIIETIRQNNQK